MTESEKYTKIFESEHVLLMEILDDPLAVQYIKKTEDLHNFTTEQRAKLDAIFEKLSVKSEHPKRLRLSELENSNLTRDRVVGFVSIKELGDAQQVTLNTDKLAALSSILRDLQKLGYHDLVLTAQTDMPLIIGGKTNGIAIAPKIEREE